MVNDPKRVLLVRSNIRLAGPGMLMHGTAHALRDRGWHVELATGGGALVEHFAREGFVHHHVPGLDLGERSVGKMAAGGRALRSIVRSSAIRVAHSFNAQAGLMAWAATRGLRVDVVNTVNGAGMERLLPLLPFKMIAVSDFLKDELQSFGVKARNIEVVHNSVIPVDKILPGRAEFDGLWREREHAPGFRFIGVAMMNGDKGQRASIEAVARMRQQNPAVPVSLTLIGDGSLRPSLEAYAAELAADDIVHFLGAQQDVYTHLDKANAFLHLSEAETFGIVLAEAQARGLPVLAYAVGGIPEIVIEGQSGFLFPRGDLAAVVRAMHDLAANPAMARDFGWNGLKRTGELFTQPCLGERLEKVYAKLR